jgi:hypothetical protein
VNGLLVTWKSELWDEIQQADADLDSFGRKLKVNTDATVSCEDRDYKDKEDPVPLACFYYVPLRTQKDVDALPADIKLLGSPGISPGDFLVLVGLHITTKEIPQWTWATFWWDNHSRSDWHSLGRPHRIGTPWNHYLMNVTLNGMTPVEQDGGPKICFNPFLETNVTNGVISNCLLCHSKAAFGSVPRATGYDLGVLGRDGKSLASGNPPMPDYFDKMVSTDFLWSLASPRSPQLTSVLAELLNVAQSMK